MESPAPFEETIYKAPTPQQQSWGTVISILIIVAMIVIGAFYAWDKRTAEQKTFTAEHEEATQ